MVQPRRNSPSRRLRRGVGWRHALDFMRALLHWGGARRMTGALQTAKGFEQLELRALLAAAPMGPPAPTPVGLQGENCAASFLTPQEFAPPDLNDPSPSHVGAPPPAFGPPVQLFVAVMHDEDDGDYSPGDLSLREAVLLANQAEADVTIHVPAGEYLLTTAGRGENGNAQGDLDLSDTNFTTRIVGDDRATTIIRGAADDRVFHVLPGSIVQISHLTIQDGLVDVGGGIFNQSLLTLDDVTIRFNLAGDRGGGIANDIGATLQMTNSLVVDNLGDLGGGIYNDRNAISLLNGVGVSNNSANSGGGIFNHGGSVTATATTIILNNAVESGGGVSNLSTTTTASFTLEDTLVNQNNVTTEPFQPGLAQGGGICNAAQGSGSIALVSVTGGQVSSNRATAGGATSGSDASAQGGGIFNRALGGTAQGVVTFGNTSITGNLAFAAGSNEVMALGGAIYNRADDTSTSAQVTVTNSDIESNVASSLATALSTSGGLATSQGGAIFNRAILNSASASIILLNSSTSSNAAIANSDGSSQTLAEGGAVYSVAGNPSAQSFSASTSITVQGGEISLNNLTSQNGSSSKASGGAIANVADYGRSTVSVTDATIHANVVTVDSPAMPTAHGGGIYNRVAAASSGSTLTLTRSTVRFNRLTVDGGSPLATAGGGIYTQGVAVLLRDSTVSANQTGLNGVGGGIFARQNLTLLNSTVSSNGAVNGGGIVVDNGNASIQNSTIADNSAEAEIGGVRVVTGALVALRNTLVANNVRLVGEDFVASDVGGTIDAASVFNWVGAGDGLAGVFDGVGGNHIGTVAVPLNPMIGVLSNNGGPTQTHLVLFGSPLIDQGESNFNGNEFDPALVQDQRTKGRVIDGNGDSVSRVDIGAVEFSPSPFGDINSDGRVNLLDAIVMRRSFGAAGPKSYADGDLNGDSLVNRADLALLLTNYGNSGPAPSPEASPAVESQAAASVVRTADKSPRDGSPGGARAIRAETRVETRAEHVRAAAVDRAIAGVSGDDKRDALHARRTRARGGREAGPLVVDDTRSLPGDRPAMIISRRAAVPVLRRR